MANTVLYIEDHRPNALLIQRLLRPPQFDVILASTATKGLDALEQNNIDIILLDINLPDIDGLTLVKQLKADERYKNIPVVALTANAMHGDREQCLQAGFDSYIPKPIIRIELLNVLRHLSKSWNSEVQ